jgi:hypothetical protein
MFKGAQFICWRMSVNMKRRRAMNVEIAVSVRAEELYLLQMERKTGVESKYNNKNACSQREICSE